MIWASAALLCCVGSNLMRGRGGGVWERAFPADTVYVRPYMRRRGTWQACACATIDAFLRARVLRSDEFSARRATRPSFKVESRTRLPRSHSTLCVCLLATCLRVQCVSSLT